MNPVFFVCVETQTPRIPQQQGFLGYEVPAHLEHIRLERAILYTIKSYFAEHAYI